VSALGSAAAGAAQLRGEGLEAVLDGGGVQLRSRMQDVEEHLRVVTRGAGVPLAALAYSTLAAGGKRLRPLLVLLAAEAAGGPGEGEQAEQRLVRAAAAVELVHSATLVHDDLIDGAAMRRGQPTVAATAGPRAAVATGDLLFARAFAELTLNRDLAQLRALSDASSALAEGELLQRADLFADQVTIARYLRRCELKTAALFEAACRLGALSARRSSAALADALAAFARHIGLAFQILDDVLDVSGPAERTGKPRGTDLLEGTVTLPLIYARERDPELARVELRGLRGTEEAEALCDRVAATGALEQARERALAAVAEAKAALPGVLASGRSALLGLLADAVVERYR